MTWHKSENDGASRRRASVERGERPAESYLVRFWLEPRERQGESAPYRGYARNLQTGEEHYFGDPRRFVEHVLRSLRTASQEPAADDEAQELEGAVG